MSDAMRPQGFSEETLSIRVNGDLRPLVAGSTIADLLGELGLGTRRVAIAVNRSVIPRSLYGERVLAADDRVEILEAVGGG
jgi:thiamine biosynthesis protein ThiS